MRILFSDFKNSCYSNQTILISKGFYMTFKLRIQIAFILTNFLISNAYCCTTVFSNNNGISPTVARTMDLYISDAPSLVIYPRNTERNGNTADNSLKWKSKYGSIVVTAFNSTAASDGMNEAGLSAHLLYLSKTKYPEADNKPTLSNLLWAQYVLDNFKTVNEALEAIEKLQIVATELHGKTWPIHLTIEDPSGDSAIVEYIDGKMKVYHGHNYRVMTNEPPYNIQMDNLKRYRSFGGNLPIPGDPDPLSRFVRASYYLHSLPNATNNLDAIAGVFSIIRTTMVPFGAVDTSGNQTEDAWPTRWVTIADLKNKMYFFNSTVTPNLIWVDLKKFDFSSETRSYSINPLDMHLVGDQSQKLGAPKK